MLTIDEILANTAEHGFDFELDVVEQHGAKSAPIPILKITDWRKFGESFPGIMLKILNGNGARVVSQRIGRAEYFAGRRDPTQIKRRNVEWLIGAKPTRVGFLAADGNMYATADEAREASIAWALAQADK